MPHEHSMPPCGEAEDAAGLSAEARAFVVWMTRSWMRCGRAECRRRRGCMGKACPVPLPQGLATPEARAKFEAAFRDVEYP